MILSSKLIAKVLISLHRCAGWSAPLLFANRWRQVFSRRGPNYNHLSFSSWEFGICHVGSQPWLKWACTFAKFCNIHTILPELSLLSQSFGVTALCPWARHIYPSLVLVLPRKTHPFITSLFHDRKPSSSFWMENPSNNKVSQLLLFF